MKITIEVEVAAPIDDVWQAWISPDDIKLWNAASEDWHCPDATIDPTRGGQFSYRMEAKDGTVGFDFAGTLTKVVPHEVIEFVLEDERTVVVEFIAGAEHVTVRETFHAETELAAEQQRQGWQAILDNFARHVERNVAT